MILRILAILMLLCCQASAESAVKKDVVLSLTRDVGFGNEVCLQGGHPDLGSSNLLEAVKLTWNPGNIWQARVALEAGASLTGRFVSRDYSAANWGNGNATDLGVPFSVNTPAHSLPPWESKTILYRTGWTNPVLRVRDLTHGGNWMDLPMHVHGPGSLPGEQIFRVDDLAPSGSELEFVFYEGGTSNFDNPSAPPASAPYQGLSGPYNYRSPLDVMLVQGGQVYSYQPSTNPSPPRVETRAIASTVAGIPGRTITIRLPRGYDEHPWKKYPVVYFHDGQNVFFPGGAFGTWDADRTGDYETSQGRMREAIIVAIPNDGANRLSEYLPNGDTIVRTETYVGVASNYADFILSNVMPTLDVHYRTLTNAENTVIAGSSMGGLVTDYITHLHPDRFGNAGIFSPAYWAAPNWLVLRDATPKLPLRRFLYMGTAETSTGAGANIYWQDALQAYDVWNRAGHVNNADLRFVGGAGAGHNEFAWATQLPAFFSFLLNPQEDPQLLALELFPPEVEVAPDAGGFRLEFPALQGFQPSLLSGGSLTNLTETPVAGATSLWHQQSIVLPDPNGFRAMRYGLP